jgi:cobaltochelatase CobN
VNGKAAETLISDLSNPQAGETVTVERYMGRELRTRYLNPKWIGAMLKEGYSGARMIRQVTDNLWGWQVTVPDAVDSAKWQEMFETYVQDRYKLGIREKFRAAENLAAYQAIVERMLTVVEKGYWQAAPATVAALREMQTDLAPAVAAENAAIAKRAEAQPAPAFSPAVNRSGKAPAAPGPSTATAAAPHQIVRGRVMEEKRRDPPRSTSSLVHISWNPTTAVTGMVALLLIALGWWRAGRGGEHP